MDKLNGRADIGDAEALPCKNMLIAFFMKVGEALGKLKLLTVQYKRPLGGYTLLQRGLRQVAGINR